MSETRALPGSSRTGKGMASAMPKSATTPRSRADEARLPRSWTAIGWWRPLGASLELDWKTSTAEADAQIRIVFSGALPRR